MPYLAVCITAALASALTLFSGFGLGTILMPTLVVFFPVETAVALTAAVHFLNNMYKLSLWGRQARWGLALRFGVPALVAAWVGARALGALSAQPPVASYEMAGRVFAVMPVKLVVAALMVGFAFFEAVPALQRISVSEKWMSLGGVLSGFFGGLSGHQGALRSVFLVRCGLSKEAFIGTGVVIACLVDASRLSVYAGRLAAMGNPRDLGLFIAVTASATSGVWLASRWAHKVTIGMIRVLVSVLLVVLAMSLAAGWI